ncbi:MAG: helix-turn-helix transcriptional regulator [Chloroflexota bacterium]|nr:helix-turn-helix transcriptional regulator [Chloroflexota bacterium]
MGPSTEHIGGFCPRYHHAVELIGRRWTGAIIRAMLGGVTRFSDLTQTVPGLSDRMLSERLKELEAEGIVERTVFPETPVRIEYWVTEKGRSLAAVVDSIATWAEEWWPLVSDGPSAAAPRAKPADAR